MNIQSTEQIPISGIAELLKLQRAFFDSGKTRDISFRISQIKKLHELVNSHQQALMDALQKDLHKPAYESLMTELGPFYSEVRHFIRHIRDWSLPETVATSLFNTPGSSQIIREPYGNVMVIAPWNYPFLLTFSPLLGAMAAGNCVILKPSEHAPHTSAVMAHIINKHFDSSYIHLIEGGIEETQALLAERWDYIFFTGGPEIGKIIYQSAAQHLTPVTLELGGKSPCIVHKDANLKLAAKRIAWGKWINSGQTCLAPDYLFVHEDVKNTFVQQIKEAIHAHYGSNPLQSQDYGKIINRRHYERLKSYLTNGNIIEGGNYDDEHLRIEPTIIENPATDSPVMQEEIFGPILPLYTYSNLEDVLTFIRQREKPLAAYLFSRSSSVQKTFLQQTSSGGVTINDTVLHISSSEMPFGGVGKSGIGGYHGKYSFDTFSHKKAVLHRSVQPLDNLLRFPPYSMSRLKIMKELLKRFL
ncbi:MAG: aldehyde dehydrogenase [Candidatus Competibacteraceae bacterium]|nr:aldehyde dehydrogenase [Candidatus Competibacteraceae bacterium]